MKQVVSIFRVLVNLHELHEKLADGVLLQTVDTAVAVFVGQDETQSRIEVIANLFAPDSYEALDDVSSLLLGR